LAGAEEFYEFLTTALNDPDNKGLLPPWFTEAKKTECMLFAVNTDSHNYNYMTEKSDIIEYYGDPRMPMQLRMFAEQVLHSSPSGQSGQAMMGLMVASEGGAAPPNMSHMSFTPHRAPWEDD
jgi:mitochondrial splicing suppressor protein 51